MRYREIELVKILLINGATLSGNSIVHLAKFHDDVAIFLAVESTAKSCYLLSMNKFQASAPGTARDVITIEFTNYKICLPSPTVRRRSSFYVLNVLGFFQSVSPSKIPGERKL